MGCGSSSAVEATPPAPPALQVARSSLPAVPINSDDLNKDLKLKTIEMKAGALIDSSKFIFHDGTTIHCGGDGGNPQRGFDVNGDEEDGQGAEYIATVYYRQVEPPVQLCAIQFETNRGRKSEPYLTHCDRAWQNSNAGNGATDWVYTARPGYQICGYKVSENKGKFGCPGIVSFMEHPLPGSKSAPAQQLYQPQQPQYLQQQQMYAQQVCAQQSMMMMQGQQQYPPQHVMHVQPQCQQQMAYRQPQPQMVYGQPQYQQPPVMYMQPQQSAQYQQQPAPPQVVHHQYPQQQSDKERDDNAGAMGGAAVGAAALGGVALGAGAVGLVAFGPPDMGAAGAVAEQAGGAMGSAGEAVFGAIGSLF